jgi:hypothetical protein
MRRGQFKVLLIIAILLGIFASFYMLSNFIVLMLLRSSLLSKIISLIAFLIIGTIAVYMLLMFFEKVKWSIGLENSE